MLEELDFICSTEYNCTNRKIGVVLIDISILMIWECVWLNRCWFCYIIERWVEIIFGSILTIVTISQIIWTIQTFRNSDSYIRVYNDHVEGVIRIPFLFNITDQGKSFSLQYHEILNVETSDDFITLHTIFGKYEAMALENKNWAREEIRKRLSTKN